MHDATSQCPGAAGTVLQRATDMAVTGITQCTAKPLMIAVVRD